MKSIKTTGQFLIEDNLDQVIPIAKQMYFEGKVFAYPTDTIYGFGADPFSEEAVSRISRIKSREGSKNYILLIGDIQSLMNYVEISREAHLDFLLSIWPNPISVVLKLNVKTRKKIGSDTAGFRIPDNIFCRMLLKSIKMPLISTSVNRSNKEPLNEPELILREFEGEIDALFYTRKKIFQTASTLIDLTGEEPVLLREGKIKFSDIMNRMKF